MTKLTDQQGSTIQQLVQRVLKLEKWRRDVTGDSPLFDIANEHTPATLSTDQNDYDPGYYDVLRINATADISITGITKGKKGRFLEFYNVSGFKITFPNESVASTSANRIINSSGQNIVLFSTGRVRMYYDSTLERWVIPDPPSWTGTYGISCRITKTSQTIPSAPVLNTKILMDTIDPLVGDEYGLFDAANNQFSIPTGMDGFYVVTLNAQYPAAVDWLYKEIFIYHSGLAVSNRYCDHTDVPNQTPWLTVSAGLICTEGDTIEFYTRQETGGDLVLGTPISASIARIR